MTDTKSFFLALFPSMPAILAALESPTRQNLAASIALPIVLFIVSKTVDVAVQLYIKPWLEGRRNK